DEAFKAMTWTQKLQRAAKMADILESHPLLAKAVSIGVNSMRMGAVAGAQNLVHTTDPEEAAKQAGVAALTTGAIETTASALKPVVANLFDKLNLPSMVSRGEKGLS